ncbi:MULTISPECIES: NAD(P)/FAD-dependent oxidoreductase [Streptomyces]|uniref:NADH-quinone oxidoreductase subunit E n=2 Tax=Streptomyces TaxID=1883 RepID=A0A1V0U5N1_STRVN|nr:MULTISPECIES: NAD(P)/FAD-dependent oxidoreductase [Streptomyces]MYW79787.1 FAD-dependent oxidoreductase [Streptomyces sp. SID8369]ARF60457.1 NADH-quinone oxidoreductase subunit E [Streptomyces violaceoruber]KOG80563.1 NADH dehydrogenase [Streptomyces griseus subsp. rhodochrous]MBD3544427.1 NAD(P)/FAD-dependent oxidoreductase [Streptomyces sp. JV180]MBD3555260.1 NAD(P)/FAD-dependent oxidoreductase [Streptomyces sp. SP18CM02]
MAPPRILVVGAGFAGVECVRRLERRLAPGEARITLVTPFSYQLYLPLLPQVASGVLTPQSVAVSLRRSRRHRTRIVPGGAIGVDPQAKVCVIRKITDEIVEEPYDYIVLAAGSVTRTFDIPGLLDNARGMKTLAEAAYVRDHVIAQLDLADASQDEAERASRLQFVVVGGGYAGTETAACLQRLTTNAVKHYPRLDPRLIKWHLIDIAPKLMPELGDKLGLAALDVLRKRNIEVSLGVSIDKAGPEEVTFTDGRVLPCRTLIWTAGVAASPLIGTLGAETVRGRLAVTPQFALPGSDGVFAAGDAAAVPDLAKGDGAICPPTAQHAMRQGKVLADNLIASLRGRPLQDYVHKDLGLVVDLGGKDAVSKPLGIELRGLPAQAVARGYHWSALRTNVAKTRVMTNWMLNAVAGDDFVRTGFQSRKPATLRDFEYTDAYLTPEQVREHTEAAVIKH